MNPESLILIRQQKALTLRRMREEKNIDRREMSKLSGLHLATIYRLESGVISWNIDSELIYIFTLQNIA